jgi:DNA excision repair protein ERCC-4
VNQAAVDLLRKLPGVTEANHRALMAAAGSLAGLADMALPQLEAAMGSARSAKALREFLDAPCPRL